MTNGPFYALLGYMIIKDLLDVRLTRLGLRNLTVKKPPEPREKKAKLPAAAEQRQEFPGDGYRPQSLPRRTG